MSRSTNIGPAFARAQRLKVARVLDAAYRVLLEDCGPHAVLRCGNRPVATGFADDRGNTYRISLSQCGVLYAFKNSQTIARSLPLALGRLPAADPKFKPPRWLV